MDRFVFFLLGAALFGGCAPDLKQGGSGGAGGVGAGGTGGTGGASVVSVGAVGGPACTDDGDCMNDECRTNGKCTANACMWDFTAAGTQIANPDYGDCMVLQCDGMGNVVNVDIEPKDRYVYSNKCYAPDCSKGTNPKAAAEGTACDTPWGKPGVCDGMAHCVECTELSQCAPGAFCAEGKCVPASCADAMKNGNETDVDCGGACLPCQAGKMCIGPADCDRTACAAGTCKTPACDDSFKNGDETDVDCGGSCITIEPLYKCGDGKVCLFPTDCQSGKCVDGKCAP